MPSNVDLHSFLLFQVGHFFFSLDPFLGLIELLGAS